jgi:ribosomal protein L9
VRTADAYLFGEHSFLAPHGASVESTRFHLRHLHAAQLERAAAAEQRRAAAAARAASHAEQRAAVMTPRREVSEAKAQVRDQRAFGAIVKPPLVVRAERADARRAPMPGARRAV